MHKLSTSNFPYLTRILLFDQFTPPVNFIQLPAPTRTSMMTHYRAKAGPQPHLEPYLDLEDPLLKSSVWVWFGAYSRRDEAPIHYNQWILPKIYRDFVGYLPPNKRLSTNLSFYKWNVNPFNYLPSSGTRFLSPEGQEIKRGLLLLKEYLPSFPDPVSWKWVLETNRIPPTLHDTILKRFQKYVNNST